MAVLRPYELSRVVAQSVPLATVRAGVCAAGTASQWLSARHTLCARTGHNTAAAPAENRRGRHTEHPAYPDHDEQPLSRPSTVRAGDAQTVVRLATEVLSPARYKQWGLGKLRLKCNH